MRELPVCDDNDFISRNWQNNKRNQHNCNIHHHHNEQQLNMEFHPSSPPSSPPSSSNQRLNGSSLLLLPPPPDPPPQPPAQKRKIGRRLTNSENTPTSAVNNSCLLPRQNPKHYSPPATIGLQRNHEGDFSIDESFYAANGQARYIY
uniref:Uncharacterized protein n=1 Tax=Meloidogyne enterolobii TaxID=390850 RepID=A0A6V7UWP9_MELEN|nr:unnamed protein product [Meloidogyne enterolobii]